MGGRLSDDERRWRTVRARDRSARGHFVYAVRSTGVFCRPGCPARLPRRENVRFFATAAEAYRAGYRPCHRCRPDAADPGFAEVARAVERLTEGTEPPSVSALARSAGLSPAQFRRRFRASVGLPPKRLAVLARDERLRTELAAGRSVTEAIHAAGFESSGRAYEGIRRRLGMTPGAYRRGGQGMAIDYTTAESSLGHVLVGATDQGACFVALGDDRESLAQSLRERFPRADLRADRAGDLPHLLATVLARVEQPHRDVALPLDLRGTAFQHRVWDALQRIPPGETVTYAELARRIGEPSASRAVAGACARNPVAVVVPCHRVVRSDGDLGGYHWGVQRKRALLDREAVPVPPPADDSTTT